MHETRAFNGTEQGFRQCEHAARTHGKTPQFVAFSLRISLSRHKHDPFRLYATCDQHRECGLVIHQFARSHLQ